MTSCQCIQLVIIAPWPVLNLTFQKLAYFRYLAEPKKAKEKEKRNKAINKGKKKKKNSLDVNPNIYRVCWNYSFGN